MLGSSPIGLFLSLIILKILSLILKEFICKRPGIQAFFVGTAVSALGREKNQRGKANRERMKEEKEGRCHKLKKPRRILLQARVSWEKDTRLSTAKVQVGVPHLTSPAALQAWDEQTTGG